MVALRPLDPGLPALGRLRQSAGSEGGRRALRPGPPRRVAGQRAQASVAGRSLPGNSAIWRRTRSAPDSMPESCGSTSMGAPCSLSAAGGVDQNGAPARLATRRSQRGDVPSTTSALPSKGNLRNRRNPVVGHAVGMAPGSTAGRRSREPIVRACPRSPRSPPGGRQKERMEHLVWRGVGVRGRGHVPGVAVRLAAIPQHLDQRRQQRVLELVRVVGVEHRAEGVEVDAASDQQAIVHRADVEHGAVEVRATAVSAPPAMSALAVAVVEEPAGVDQRPIALPESRMWTRSPPGAPSAGRGT